MSDRKLAVVLCIAAAVLGRVWDMPIGQAFVVYALGTVCGALMIRASVERRR